MASLNPRLVFASWTYSNQVISLLVGVVQVKMLTTFLAQQDYGTWVQVNVTISMLALLLGCNLSHSLLRLGGAAEENGKRYFISSNLIFLTGLFVILGFVIYPMRDVLAELLGVPSQDSYLISLLLLLAWFTVVSNHLKNFFIITDRSIVMVRLNTLLMPTVLACVVTGAWLTHSLRGVVAGFVIGQLIGALIWIAYSRANLHLFRFDQSKLVEGLRIGMPLLMVSFAYWGIRYSNRYFISGHLGAEMVAVFNVANVLPSMIATVYTLLASVFFVKLSRLFDEDRVSEISEWFTVAVKLYTLFAISLVVVLVTASTQLTLMLSNNHYLHQDTTVLFALVAMGSYLFGLLQLASRPFDLEKKPLRSSANWLLALLLNSLLCWYLIPILNITGAAVAMVLSLAGGIFLATRYRMRGVTLIVPWARLVLFVFGTPLIAVWITTEWVATQGMFSAFLFAGVAGVATLALGYVLQIVQWSDVRLVLER